MKKQEFIDFKEMSSKFIRESSFNDIIKNKELRNRIKESISDKQIFRKFLKESELGGGLILTEAQSLLRVIERIEDKSFQMLTQFRQNYSVQENLDRNSKMVKVIRHRFKNEFNIPIEKTGFYQLVGHFPEKQKDGSEIFGKEYSQLWIKPERMSVEDFKYLMVDVACVENEQDSVFIFDREIGEQNLYILSKSFRHSIPIEMIDNKNGLFEKVELESGLSYYKTDKEELLKNIEKEEWDGEVINMNNLSINKMGEFYSRMRGKQKRIPFVFEGFKYPSSPQSDKFFFKKSGILFN